MEQKKQTQVIHAVIPAAGWGTRFFPFTKSVPKELVPIGETPAINYVVNEAYSAGITHVIFISNPRKTALQHYFSPADSQLKSALAYNKSVQEKSDALDALVNSIKTEFIMQDEQKGLGHAVSLSKHSITHDLFAVLLPDDLLFGKTPCLQDLITLAQQYNACVIAVQKIDPKQSSSYGVIQIKKQISDSLFAINDVVEKPQPEHAPSSFGIIGRYVLTHELFDAVSHTEPDARGEIQLTNALKILLQRGRPVLAYVVPHTRFDVGTPEGFLDANLFVAKNR